MSRALGSFLCGLAVAVSFGFLTLTVTAARAASAEEVKILPMLDALNRGEESLSNSAKWAALAWDSSTTGHNTGRDTTSGWGPYDSFSTVNGAYWTPSVLNDSTGDAASVTMQLSPNVVERYVSVWLDMPSPSSAKTGYQLRWTETNSSTNMYSVTLSKWSAGTQTVLASNAAVVISPGTTMAISDTGATVTAWQSTGSSFSSLLSAADSTFSNGYAGIEASGSNSHSTNFKAGPMVGSAIAATSVRDNLERSEYPFPATTPWSKTSWAGSVGGAWGTPYRGYGGVGVSGAYWNPSSFADSGETALTAATVGTGATYSGEYLGLWLDMPNPGSERSGYEARFTGTNSTSTGYQVELSKWVAGTRTVLASTSGFSLPVGTTVALTETSGGILALWSGSGTSMTPVLTAADSTYTGGYAGLEVNGGAGTLYNFRAGQVFKQPPDTSITAGPNGNALPNVAFSFNSNKTGTSFECSLDSAAYSACTAPASYPNLTEGAHIFKVRAVSSEGTDETPAERHFQVVAPAKATSKVAVLDNLERTEHPFPATAKWSKTSWAEAVGGAWGSPFRGYGGVGLSGAYWNPGGFSDGGQSQLVAATVGTGSPATGEYLAVWLDMPNPASERTGYEARFTGTGSATAYQVELAKWVAGTRIVLGSTSGFSLSVGTTITLSETAGGTLALWSGTSTSMSQVLSAADGTYTTGYAGLEVKGGAGTLYNFRAGQPDLTAPNTTIQTGPSGVVQPENVSFTFTATEGATSFECSLDSASYTSCTSPKAYFGLPSGSSHTFRVRAVDALGNQDETPAERNFTVVALPSAATNAATTVKSSEATLNATVNPNGSETSYQFEYGTTTSYGTKTPATAKALGSGSSSVEANQPVTGLQPGTTYHYRISATNAAGTSHGEDRTFTTTTPPSATTEAATAAGTTTATLNAIVNPHGVETTYQFEYGTTTSYGATSPSPARSIGSGTTPGSANQALSGLAEGTTYHYRVVAASAAGITYGADRTFSTLSMPGASTEEATGITGTEVIVNATVNPNGASTAYEFEYGTTSSYGSAGPAGGGSSGSGIRAVDASEDLEELEPNTTYHYRVVASSAAGISYGVDRTFTTGAQGSGEETWLHGKSTGKEGVFTSAFGIGENEVVEPSIDLMWGGGHESDPAEMEAIHREGASMLRLQIQPTEPSPGFYPAVFANASKQGITILPYLYGGGGGPEGQQFPETSEQQTAYDKWVEQVVATYGPTGSFWKGNTTQAPSTWEVWNEPNVGRNNPGGQFVNPTLYATFLKGVSQAIANASGKKAHAMIGGLLTVTTVTPAPGSSTVEEISPAAFLKGMGSAANGSYTAVGVHPYVFKAINETTGEAKVTAPKNTKEVEAVARRVKEQIRKARVALTEVQSAAVPIWITELGWPLKVVADPRHEGIECTATVKCQQIQGELINYTFDLIKENAKQWNIPAIFYFNDRDVKPEGVAGAEWWWYCGLRSAGTLTTNPETHQQEVVGAGKFRLAAFAFEAEAGVPRWPQSGATTTEPASALSRRVTMPGRVNPNGLPGKLLFRYGTTTSYGKSTKPKDVGFEHEVSLSETVTGLQPNTTYHYKAISINENGEEGEGIDRTFTTEAHNTSIDTSIRVLNGEPGWLNISGHVTGTENVVNQGYVNINLHKKEGGVWVEKEPQHANVVNGVYNLENFSAGKGEWEINVVYPGFGEFDEARIPAPHKVTIQNGYQIVSYADGKCLEVAENSGANGAGIHQWECGNGATRLDQVFTLVPSPTTPLDYELVARNSGKCIDVDGASQGAGAGTQQYECLGWGQTNQVFQGTPVFSGQAEPVRFVAQHSGQCLEVQNGASNNGAVAVQNPCTGANPQSWTLRSVEANQVPVEASITVDEELNGHPGYVTLHGNVYAGGWNLNNQPINVEFEHSPGSGAIDTLPLKLDANGHFSYTYWGISTGDWYTRVHFFGAGPLAAAYSEYRKFHVGDGYRFRFRQSGKCLSTSEGKTSNGTAILQWDCSPAPSAGDGQVFSVEPVDYNLDFQIRDDANTNMCLDVTNVSQENGAKLQLYQCLGAGQTNQIWHLVPIAGQPPWYAWMSENSNKCMDVSGESLNNGTLIQQWECWWGGNQQWEWQGIG